jgi:hypothetical protein
MKTRVAIAVGLLMLMTCPVQAQMGTGGRRHQGGDDKKSEQKRPQVDEKAYKSALEKIPEPKTKYDPWGMTRPAEIDKKPK